MFDIKIRKQQMVLEYGLPLEMAEMLSGTTDKEIWDSAMRLAAGLKTAKAQQSSKQTSPAVRSFGASGTIEKSW